MGDTYASVDVDVDVDVRVRARVCVRVRLRARVFVCVCVRVRVRARTRQEKAQRRPTHLVFEKLCSLPGRIPHEWPPIVCVHNGIHYVRNALQRCFVVLTNARGDEITFQSLISSHSVAAAARPTLAAVAVDVRVVLGHEISLQRLGGVDVVQQPWGCYEPAVCR